MQRYFLSENVTTNFTLDAETYRHFVTVLRAKVGTQAEFVLPNETVIIAKLISVTSTEAKMTVVSEIKSNVELPVKATIICGLPKGDKTELIVQKATELGVNRIIFVQTAWSVTKWRDKVDKKLIRLQKIAAGAAEQSHRTIIPQVEFYEKLADVLSLGFDNKLIAYEEAAKAGEQAQLTKTFSQLQSGTTIATVFGPEGGLAPNEVELLVANGYQVAALGPRILRAETAPLYWLSTLSYALELA